MQPIVHVYFVNRQNIHLYQFFLVLRITKYIYIIKQGYDETFYVLFQLRSKDMQMYASPRDKKNYVSYVFSQLPKNEIRNAINADDRLEMTSPSRPIRAGGHSKMPPRSYLLITLSLCKIEYQKIFNFVINKLGANIL